LAGLDPFATIDTLIGKAQAGSRFTSSKPRDVNSPEWREEYNKVYKTIRKKYSGYKAAGWDDPEHSEYELDWGRPFQIEESFKPSAVALERIKKTKKFIGKCTQER